MAEPALLRVALGLAFVLAAILACAWLARRAGLVHRGAGRLLRQVAQLPLGARASVVVVQVEQTWLVLGVTAGQVTLLHTLPADEPPPEGVPVAPAASFAAHLGQMLKRRG